MLNLAVRLRDLDKTHATVAWTTPWPDGASWVFVNGKRVVGPHVTGTAERSVRIPMGDSSFSVALEVHDFEATDLDLPPVEIEPNTRPILVWKDVADAVRFRIYHKERDAQVAEELIYDRARRTGQTRHHVLCPAVLNGVGGIWHLFRVEAVDPYGNESERDSWAYFVSEPAAEPAVTAYEGSADGLYTVHLET